VIPALLRAYQLLQVAPWADRDQVRHAYFAKAKQYHPDLGHGGDSGGEEMIQLTRARELVEARAARLPTG
jgi:curved DNA-binding protein CbpA